jgi:hypothetical protein
MCLLDLLSQILKAKEGMGRNVKGLEQQNLVLFLRHGGFECLCLRVSALAKLPQRIGLTVMAVCQQSSTTGSPISARAEGDGIVRGLPNLLNHVLLRSIYCHTGQGYMCAGVTAALFPSNIPSCSSRGNALPTLLPYSTCVVFSIASEASFGKSILQTTSQNSKPFFSLAAFAPVQTLALPHSCTVMPNRFTL